MSNQEHFDRLIMASDANDMKAWNEWRENSPEVCPDLAGANLGEANLNDVILSGANLSGANLHGTGLSGADLVAANLSKADLGRADLSGADLTKADLSGAKLGGANLTKADLIGANLVGAHLTGAHLVEANLVNANLAEAAMTWADLRDSDLTWADLRDADLGGANLERANVTGVRFNRWSTYRGIRVSSCYGSSAFRRFAQDQEYIEELRASSPWGKLVYISWLIFADCGRSMIVWAMWCATVMLGFACGYWALGADAFRRTELAWEPTSALYYSVAIFTTLGLGDLSPRTRPAVICMMVEAILGYLMLAGLISILYAKLARKS